ncbi:MAG: nuclear transport factor 2 family protein [Steroidobacteraceae bacterium]
MTDRRQMQQLVRELHGARLDGDLERLCALFTPDAKLRIVGTSDGKAITIAADGLEQIRTWLAMMVKTFRLAEYELLSTLIDGESAAVRWRAQIRSRITGVIVPTELIDLVDAREGHIAAHTEFFVPG